MPPFSSLSYIPAKLNSPSRLHHHHHRELHGLTSRTSKLLHSQTRPPRLHSPTRPLLSPAIKPRPRPQAVATAALRRRPCSVAISDPAAS
ncbi:hypothetical protein M0R45_002290 [Rubus argutus]|uniref:Uncharacterized protein n=1 Tax=Rubus argutus TaxID=59490 RepID=A0AAW1VIE6_RUBAR